MAAKTLMTLLANFFTEETERQSRHNVVQTEVSFVSTGRDSDKPETINIWILSGYCRLKTLRHHKTF